MEKTGVQWVPFTSLCFLNVVLDLHFPDQHTGLKEILFRSLSGPVSGGISE